MLRSLLKILTVFIVLLCFAFTANAEKHKSLHFTIDGYIHGNHTKKIYFFYEINEASTLDSATIHHGRFIFKGIAARQPVLSYLMFSAKGKTDYLFLFTEAGVIHISTTADSFFNGSVSGTPVNDQLNHFNRQARKPSYQLYVIERAIQDATGWNDQTALDSLTKAHAVVEKELNTYRISYIVHHPDNYFSGFLLYKLGLNMETTYDSLYQRLPGGIKRSEYVLMFKKAWYDFNKVKIGDRLPDFTLPDQYDKRVQLSAFKGKYVLLVFWASWCPPCRHENHVLDSIYNTIQKNSMQFISISVDENKTEWIDAVNNDKLAWPNVLSTNQQVEQLFGVADEPQNILLDKDQKVIAKNISMDQLKARIQLLFP